MPFSWIPFYREVAQEVLKYENDQATLLNVLADMKSAGLPTIPLEDNQVEGPRKPLTEIDPFTFLANLSRTGDAQATVLCEGLKKRWDLIQPVPNDFHGRAKVEAQNSWFFASTQKGRGSDDVPLLWELAKQAFEVKSFELDAELFTRCLKIKNVAIKKLSAGLFWFSPNEFLPLVGPMVPYLTKSGIMFDAVKLAKGDLDEYHALMGKADSINSNKAALCNEAWQWIPEESSESIITEFNEAPLNQILYGPPGTGKTYNSVRRAVEIIDGTAPIGDARCKKRFDELRAKGQIEFVTFHQSFSYEEFIEGLRPLLNVGNTGAAHYEIRNGVLKEICLNAISGILQYKGTFDSSWRLLTKRIERIQTTEICEQSEYSYEISLKNGSISGTREDGTPLFCTKQQARDVWIGTMNTRYISAQDVKRCLGKDVAGEDLLVAVINEMSLEIYERPIRGEQKFLNGDAHFAIDNTDAQRYVLIVDEINRGNISKILGELITLLEEDKRLGKDNELRVKLPVSGTTFSLPPNLYILGTMNTADKSLALLDIALRRRFSFVEMPPKVDLFPDFAREVLKTLNLRLEAALDREHRLGHAYFINCKDEADFNQVFRDKIVPLLQEFFYNDWETLRQVLGESTRKDGFIRELPPLKGLKARTKWRWWFDVEGGGELNPFALLTANYAALNSNEAPS